MAMTAQGLVTLRYQEIMDRIRGKLFNEISPDIDLSENSAMGILLGTVADRLTELHEAISEVYDAGTIAKAEGDALDDLCQLNEIYRYLARPTSGEVEVTGAEGSRVEQTTRIKTTAGDIFNPREGFTLTSSECIEAWLKVGVVSHGTGHAGRYVIIINNVEYVHMATATDDAKSILAALHKLISGGVEAHSELLEDGTVLRIYKDPNNITERTEPMSVAATAFLTYTKVICNVKVISEQTGAISGLAGMLNSFEAYPSGIEDVYNRYDLTDGRDQESDDELRARYLSGLTNTGKGTADATLSAVQRLEGVTQLMLIENPLEVDDKNGIPPKSFELIVAGGSTEDIAQAIWDNKPLGIRTWGTSEGVAHDIFGGEHIMHFQRPYPKYTFVKLSFKIFDEEALNFPLAEIPDQIKRGIEEYGATLRMGVDIIPNKIMGYVYGRVHGIQITSVGVALTTDQMTPPTGAYSSERITINEGEYSVWETNQYEITQVS